MDELMDKLERARFLAVQRLRRANRDTADMLDFALFLRGVHTSAISLTVPAIADSGLDESELGELDKDWIDAASEEELADKMVELADEFGWLRKSTPRER